MTLVVGADAESLVKGYVQTVIDAGQLPTPPAGSSWTVKTIITPGVTPAWTIQVRMIGGVDEQRVAERPLVDLRVWADGTTNTDGIRSATARALLARVRSQFSCSVFALPVPLPDPADNSKVHTLFTVQLLVKGSQQ